MAHKQARRHHVVMKQTISRYDGNILKHGPSACFQTAYDMELAKHATHAALEMDNTRRRQIGTGTWGKQGPQFWHLERFSETSDLKLEDCHERTNAEDHRKQVVDGIRVQKN